MAEASEARSGPRSRQESSVSDVPAAGRASVRSVSDEPESPLSGSRHDDIEGGNPNHQLPVLVVDDDSAVRWLFARTLERAGLQAVEAAGGRDALDLISQRAFSAVLLDNHMPGMSGLDLIRELRSRPESATLPIILITGSSNVADRVTGLQAGASDYLAKPVDLYELVARVKAQLREQQAWLHVVEGHLRERAAIAHALSQISPAATPELTADVICFELSLVRNLSSVALLGFTEHGIVVPLAQHGPALPPLEVGRPLPPPLAQYLQQRAKEGPWIEKMSRDTRFSSESLSGFAISRAGAPSTIALAPMQIEGDLLGLLILGAESRTGEPSANYVASTLSAAIDFARVAAGILSPGLREREMRHAQRAGIDKVLQEQQFHPVFQPIVDLEARRVVGYEVLTRFTDGTRPDLRFTEAARLGVGIDLEVATLKAALEAAVGLPSNAWISLNVSPSLVLDTDDLGEALANADRAIVLELTEHDRIDDYGEIREALGRLGSTTKLSVDDAGSGFASLRHVLALEPDFVKLDHSWVTGLHGDPARQALVAGLEYFASEAGCRLIAEGIETELDLAACQKLDVELGQGYLLGRPDTVERFN